MVNLIRIIIKIVIIIIFPPLMIGLINRIKELWAGKYGQSIFQPFYDIIKLIKKKTVRSTNTSFIFNFAISLQLFSNLFIIALLPFGNIRSMLSFDGDFFIFIGLLGLSTISQILIAMESSGSFEGMGASREINFSIFVEPALILLLASMIFFTKNISLNKILLEFSFNSFERSMIGILLGISFFLIILIEGKRIPIDDPTTHLELTMIHEAMLLDLSGKDLAISIYSSYLKIFIFSSFIANIFITPTLNPFYGILIFIIIILLISFLVGITESIFPRVRMSHVPDFMLLVFSISILIIAIIYTMNI